MAISTDILEFRARVLVIHDAAMGKPFYLNPGHGSARLHVRPGGPLLLGVCFQTPGPPPDPVGGRPSALRGHAAASIDGHVPQASPSQNGPCRGICATH
jgi:hypothetical protein